MRGASGITGSFSFLRRLRFGFSSISIERSVVVVSRVAVPFGSVVTTLVFRLRARTFVTLTSGAGSSKESGGR